MDVKVLTYTSPQEIEKVIKRWVNEFEYTLAGPVSVGTSNHGNTIYVATLIKPEGK